MLLLCCMSLTKFGYILLGRAGAFRIIVFKTTIDNKLPCNFSGMPRDSGWLRCYNSGVVHTSFWSGHLIGLFPSNARGCSYPVRSDGVI